MFMTSEHQNIWSQLVGEIIVIDASSPFVFVGRLQCEQDGYLVLEDADAHDLRDSPTTREKYILETRTHGVRANRGRVWVSLREIVSVSRLDDVREG